MALEFYMHTVALCISDAWALSMKIWTPWPSTLVIWLTSCTSLEQTHTPALSYPQPSSLPAQQTSATLCTSCLVRGQPVGILCTHTQSVASRQCLLKLDSCLESDTYELMKPSGSVRPDIDTSENVCYTLISIKH